MLSTREKLPKSRISAFLISGKILIRRQELLSDNVQPNAAVELAQPRRLPRWISGPAQELGVKVIHQFGSRFSRVQETLGKVCPARARTGLLLPIVKAGRVHYPLLGRPLHVGFHRDGLPSRPGGGRAVPISILGVRFFGQIGATQFSMACALWTG